MKFRPGDPVPWFVADTHTTKQFQFSAAGGRYVVLSFLGSATRPDSARIVADIDAQRIEFNDEHCCFFGVTLDAADVTSGRVREWLPGVRYFQDLSGAISREYGALPADTGLAGYRPFSLVLDERMRVLHVVPVEGDAAGHVARLLNLTRSLPALGQPKLADTQAPVLMVPRVFEPELCRRLIQYYRDQGSEESGFMRDVNGKTVGVYDYGTKRRRDSNIEDETLRKQCMFRIHDRVAPEILKAFQFSATRMERYIVACYESELGGHFRAHRDNTTKGTAHRKFAVTLNLNDDFDGGCLWFPEFGRQLFRPPAGGACVFSCSLLHEATPVTRGIRFVFLPFLYDDQAAKLREQNEQFLGGNLNTPPA